MRGCYGSTPLAAAGKGRPESTLEWSALQMDLKDGAICLPDSTMADRVPTMQRTLANIMAGARPTGAVSSGYGK